MASIVPCYEARFVGFCAVATAGPWRAAGKGLVDDRSVTIPYLALGARVVVRVPLTSALALVLALGADLLWAPLVQAELRVDGQDLWTSPPLALSAGLGVAVRFPWMSFS